MRLYKRGEIYWIDFSYENKRYRLSTKTKIKTLAKEFAETINNEIYRGIYSGRVRNFLTWREALAFYLQSKGAKLSHSSLNNYSVITKHLKSCKVLNDIAKTEGVEVFANFLKKRDLTEGSIKSFLSKLQTVYLFCEKKGKPLKKCIFNLEDYKASARDFFFTKDEFNKFISCVKEPFYKHFFILMLHTGARINELLTLTKDRIFLDSDTPHLFIPASFNKTRKDKQIPLISKDAIDSLKYLLNKSRDNKLVNISQFKSNVRIKNYCKQSGYKNWEKASNHMFRHTFLTWAETGEFDFLNGKPMSDRLRKFVVGHSKDSKTTENYTHFKIEDFFKLISN